MALLLTKKKDAVILDHENGEFSLYRLDNGSIYRTMFRGPAPDEMKVAVSISPDDLERDMKGVLSVAAFSVLSKITAMVKRGNHTSVAPEQKKPTDTSKLINL